MKAGKFVFLVFLIMLSLRMVNPTPVKSQSSGTIYIRADGSVEGTDKIQRDGNVYTFTSDIFDSIEVQKDGVIIDGAGYTLNGTGVVDFRGTRGIDMAEKSNVTVKNLRISNFYHGIYMPKSDNNTFYGNYIADCMNGFWMYGSSYNTIAYNTVTNNQHGGIYIVYSSSYNIVYGNNITNNMVFLWMQGEGNIVDSNYWSSYSGLDDNGDGIGDTPYVFYKVDSLSYTDSHPLMKPAILPPTIILPPPIIRAHAIYIRADGSVEPSTAPILKNGNVYTLIRNMTGTISIYRGNVVVNGAGYTIQNPHGTTGVRIFSHGVAVINLTITKTGGSTTEDDIGIEILHGSHALIANNTIIGNQRIKTASIYAESAIYIYVGSNNTIVGNTIKDNQEGLYFIAVMGQGTASNNLIYGNNFINNTQNVVNAALLASTPLNTWNNASFGNYWSDYNGTDADGDGIGDTPYVINAENQDNYPLMKPVNISAIIIPEFPDTTPPTISIASPENKTYTVNNVSLTFAVNELTSWVGYSLDGQANVTITGGWGYSNNWSGFFINTTLTGLSFGEHSLTVYAKDNAGNTGTSETIYFSIRPQFPGIPPEPFPTTWIIAAIVIIAIGGVVILVYFRKIRKTTGKAE